MDENLLNGLDGLFKSPRALSIQSAALDALGVSASGGHLLEPLKLSGTEGINQLFEYQLILQTPDAVAFAGDLGSNLPLSSLIGRELSCSIELEGFGSFASGLTGDLGLPNVGAGSRQINGLITAARYLGLDSRHALYEITLRPWLHLATLNRDCKVFQDQTPVEVIEAVLGKYPFSFEKRLLETYPARDYSVQYNESDFEFVTRLLQEWGLNYHFEHQDGIHKLVISDHNGAFQSTQKALAQSAYHSIPYYPPRHKIDREYIHAFVVQEQLSSGTYSSRDYDYTRPRAVLQSQHEAPRETGQNQQAVYRWRDSDYSQPNAGADKQANRTEEQGDHLARLRMQALRQHGLRAKGSGHLRAIVPGCTFNLSGYELLRFGRNLGPDRLPAKAAHWRKIVTPAGEVWADLNGANTCKFSDADFPPVMGWNCINDDSSPEDQRCDSLNLKTLIRDPAPGDYQRMDPSKLALRLGKPEVREQLKRVIAQFPNEWDQTTISTRYGFAKELFKQSLEAAQVADAEAQANAAWSRAETHLKSLSFVGLPANYINATWHLHPREFIRQMRKCGWLSKEELKRIYPDKKYPVTALSKLHKTPDSVRNESYISLNRVMRRFLIETPIQRAHFLGEGAVESMHLSVMVEGSVSFSRNPTHPSFQPEISGFYAPTDKTNYLFYLEGRNGNIEPGDGPKFRGRGMKQLTARENYSKYWVFRGWLDAKTFTSPWWNPSRPNRAPIIPDPQRLSIDVFNSIDAGGWYWHAGSANNHFASINSAIRNNTIDEESVLLVATSINGVNRSTGKPNQLKERLQETKDASEILMDKV